MDPGTALAATADTSGSTLTYTASPGETNRATITLEADGYHITDTGAAITPGLGCASVSTTQVTCTATGVTALVTDLGDLADRITVSAPTNALISGGDGNDSLAGGAGADGLNGGEGNDVLDGGAGPDALSGGPAIDLADYGARTNPVAVTLDGSANDGEAGEGDNVGADVENVLGGAGADSLTGSAQANSLDGGGGDDRLAGGDGRDVLAGGDGNDSLDGGPGNDPVRGGFGADSLSGGEGSDVLDGGPGPDLLNGGPAIDRAEYGTRTNPVAVTLDGSANDGEAGEGDNVGADVENVLGGAGADSLTGSAQANSLDGGGGNDRLAGGDGRDVLAAGDGNDSLDGGPGSDALRGGAGADSLGGGEGSDVLDGGPGPDALSGGPAIDLADFGARTKPVSVTLDGSANDGEAGERDQVRGDVESVRTGSGNDTIDSRDGRSGRITCGAGTDSVRSDSDDVVSRDCEKVGVGILARCSISRRAVTASSKWTVGVRITCLVKAAGTLTLTTARALRAVTETKRARTLRLGRKRFRITRQGRPRTVRVKLSRKARRVLRRYRRLRVKAKVSVRPTGVRDAATATASRTITVRAPNKKRSRK